MRSATSLTGKRIVSVDNGTDLGTVKDVYFDADVSSIVGLFLGISARDITHSPIQVSESRFLLPPNVGLSLGRRRRRR